jgi:hypothetical protein
MRSKKTVNVADLLWKANFFLKNSKPEQFAERKATHNFMSGILHDTGNYKGFGYHNMVPKASGEGFDIPDESRTFFYINTNLVEDFNAAEKRHQEMFS